MRTHDTTQVRTGIDVYGSDGEKIGTVADASNYFVIERGYLFTTDLFVPASAIAAVLDDRLELNLTKEQIERGNYTSRMGDGASDACPETMRASGIASHGTAHIADRDVSERREERRTVDEDVDHLGRVHTLGGQATPSPRP